MTRQQLDGCAATHADDDIGLLSKLASFAKESARKNYELRNEEESDEKRVYCVAAAASFRPASCLERISTLKLRVAQIGRQSNLQLVAN